MGDTNELDDLGSCSDCEALLLGFGDQSFVSGPETYLCFLCAERRGGVYDAAQDRWTVPPDVSGLTDERQPYL